MSNYCTNCNAFGISVEQYHAGLDKLWGALEVSSGNGEDVFTRSANTITDLKAEVERLRVLVTDLRGEIWEHREPEVVFACSIADDVMAAVDAHKAAFDAETRQMCEGGEE